jgi:hypothetical protein
MRIYNSAIEALNEIERDISEMGIVYQSATVQDQDVSQDDNFQTKELISYSYMLTKWEDIVEAVSMMDIPIDWVAVEMEERLDLALINKNPGLAWRLRSDLFKPFLRNGVFSYSYPERFHAQLPYIIHELKTRPFTRQAMLTMYESSKDIMSWGGQDRVPCSLSYQFLIRNGELIVIYNQRSCDYKKFLASDMYFACMLLECVAQEVGVKLGAMIHNVGSLHCFKKDLTEVF